MNALNVTFTPKKDKMFNSSVFQSNKLDWETPKPLFEKLNQEFEFTLDVCASDTNKKVNTYFDGINKDGLKENWFGTAWMNPPYGKELKKWIEKAYLESLKGVIVVCLIPCRTDTKYWHDFIMKASEIRFLNKRLSFENSHNKAPFPAAIVIFDKTKKDLKVTSYSTT